MNDEPSPEEEIVDDTPLFQHALTNIPLDMLEDWIVTLAHENVKRIRDVEHGEGLFLKNRSVEFLFVLCEKLNVPANVKYSAAALFDNFMLRHVAGLRDELMKSKSTTKEKDWKAIEDKISSQVTLRIFSCVQIASKMENQTKSVQISDFNRLLRGMGLCYTAEHILKSEVRVLKTLEYQINTASPLVFVETLLKILHLQHPMLPVDPWYKWCLMVLDAILLVRDEIYAMLVKAILGDTTIVDRERMVKIQSDYLLLASAVITTAAFVASGREVAEQVAALMQNMCGVSFKDVTHFCAAVVERVLISNSRQARPSQSANRSREKIG